MDVDAILGQIHWITVVVAAVVSIIVTAISNLITWLRYRREYRLQNHTQYVLRRLLRDKRFKNRTFATLQGYIPLPDQELREALLRAGAVGILKREGNDENWLLLEHNRDRVFPKTRLPRKS